MSGPDRPPVELKTTTVMWPCPHCGSANDAHHHPARRPRIGAFSICLHCRQVARFDLSPLGAGLFLRTLTDDEQAMVAYQPQYQGLRTLLAHYDDRKKGSSQ